uniref:Uncharacterized protein n=1 Tax=Arundo donax TaxID=35708 RepID=A0A0A8YL85_ARUDO
MRLPVRLGNINRSVSRFSHLNKFKFLKKIVIKISRKPVSKPRKLLGLPVETVRLQTGLEHERFTGKTARLTVETAWFSKFKFKILGFKFCPVFSSISAVTAKTVKPGPVGF